MRPNLTAAVIYCWALFQIQITQTSALFVGYMESRCIRNFAQEKVVLKRTGHVIERSCAILYQSLSSARILSTQVFSSMNWWTSGGDAADDGADAFGLQSLLVPDFDQYAL